MRRIAIVGCPGSGKSTLARTMGERLGLPIVHLDLLYWRAGWRAVSDDEMRQAVDAASMAETWISEGLAIDSSALRLFRADTIVWLDMHTLTCLRRAVLRVPKNLGRTRPDLPAGCPEKFDLKFYRWIWLYERRVRPRLRAAIRRFGANAQLIRLSNDGEVAAFISALPRQASSRTSEM
jgi:adenylate kinase family enzyme